jgi:hypothetical protein
VLLSVLAAASLAAKRPLQVIDTTIEAVNKDPVKFHNKVIRVRGVVDQCISLSCNICAPGESADRDDDEDLCLAAGFWEPGTGREYDRDKNPDYLKWYFARRYLENLYRFSEVTVEGHYDALCKVNFDPAKSRGPTPDRVVVCTDNGTTLTIERVVAVHARIPAPRGKYHSYSGFPLRPATPAENRELLEAYRALLSSWDDARDPMPETAAFRVEHDPPDQLLFCVCLNRTCRGEWPTLSGHDIRTPNNPYDCTTAKRMKGGWKLAFES